MDNATDRKREANGQYQEYIKCVRCGEKLPEDCGNAAWDHIEGLNTDDWMCDDCFDKELAKK